MAVHQFDVETAIQHGIEAAILIENIRFWLTKNKANGVNAKEGFWWTYNSAEAFHKLFPYIERRQICRVLTSLCTKGVLLKKKLNEANFDKTYWYTIPSEFMVENEVFKPEPLINSIGQNVQSNGQNDQRIGQNDQRIGQNVHPIPDSKHTDNKQQIIKQQINKAVDNSKQSFFELLSGYGIEGDLAEDFIQHRKSKKGVLSKTVLNSIQKEANLAHITVAAAVEIMLLRNWQGFNHKWLEDTKPAQGRKNLDFTTPAQYVPNPLGDPNEKIIN